VKSFTYGSAAARGRETAVNLPHRAEQWALQGPRVKTSKSGKAQKA